MRANAHAWHPAVGRLRSLKTKERREGRGSGDTGASSGPGPSPHAAPIPYRTAGATAPPRGRVGRSGRAWLLRPERSLLSAQAAGLGAPPTTRGIRPCKRRKGGGTHIDVGMSLALDNSEKKRGRRRKGVGTQIDIGMSLHLSAALSGSAPERPGGQRLMGSTSCPWQASVFENEAGKRGPGFR